jgi:hypothetical protein
LDFRFLSTTIPGPCGISAISLPLAAHEHGLPLGGSTRACLLWVKLRNTQCEEISSGLPRRDSYERLVEENIFCDVVRRGVDRIETQKLRMVHLSDALAMRFHDGMTKANTYSHDNPASNGCRQHPAVPGEGQRQSRPCLWRGAWISAIACGCWSPRERFHDLPATSVWENPSRSQRSRARSISLSIAAQALHSFQFDWQWWSKQAPAAE